jgi:hypothetical protein
MIDTNLNQIEQTKVFQHNYIYPRPYASPTGLSYHISRYDLGWQPNGYTVQSVIYYTCSSSMWHAPQYPSTAVTITINKHNDNILYVKAMDMNLQIYVDCSIADG